MATSKAVDKSLVSMSDPVALAALEGRATECDGWDTSRGNGSGVDLCCVYHHSDFSNGISRYGDENRTARIYGVERDDTVVAPDWPSVSQHRVSSASLVPAPLFTPRQSGGSSIPPPIPAKSPDRIKRLLKLIFEHVDAEEILWCIHARLLPWSALRDHEGAARKLWLIAVAEPVEVQQYLPAAAVGPEGAPSFYLNPLIHSLKAYGGAENLPFDSTSCKYQKSTGDWFLKVRCSEAALGLRNRKSWGEMRLAYAAAGTYHAKVSVYGREPSERGTVLEHYIECTNATKVKELMIWVIASLIKQETRNDGSKSHFPLPSTVSRTEARWLEKTLGGDPTFRHFIASGHVTDEASASIDDTRYMTRKIRRLTKVHRSRLPIGVRSNLRYKVVV